MEELAELAITGITKSLYMGTGEGRVHAGRCTAVVREISGSSLPYSFDFLEEIGSKIMNVKCGWERRHDTDYKSEKRGENWALFNQIKLGSLPA